MHKTNMNHYKNYGTEDLVWDTFFRQWVLSPTRETDNTWKEWMAANPEMTDKINQARMAVLSLKVNEPPISDQEIAWIVKETIARTSSGVPAGQGPHYAAAFPFYKRIWFSVAASLTLLLFFGWLVKSRLDTEGPAYTKVKEVITAENDHFIERVNNTSRPMVLSLEDGSKVTLTPASKISYAKKMSASKREVYLAGEAFFEISKDPERPFFVYAKALVTKVLGTSFTVKAYERSKEITVEVKTGRVSVFAQSDPDIKEKAGNRALEGIVLSPNQKIIYTSDNEKMVKTLVEKPEIIVPKAQIPQFIFEDVPVSEVFDSIAKAYGIEIVYDEELLQGCPLTAILDNQTLHEKLTIICKAIEADYEILDGQIIIHGKGCRN
jgi:transmembrane sensor